MRKLVTAVGIGLLLVVLALPLGGSSSAANLTGGQYTYVINGEEATFSFDPIVRKEGLLLPLDVFQTFGILVEGALTRTPTLKKADVSAQITLGTATYQLKGVPQTLPTAPLRLNGRLFVPADLLRQFGVEYSQDGNYVVMQDFGRGVVVVKSMSDYDAVKSSRTFTASVKADSGQYLNGEFTLLNADLISASNWDVNYGARARLLHMLQSNTLVLVKLSNTGFKSGGMVTGGLYLIDAQRNQYDFNSAIDIGYGLVSAKLVPGADRWGVLSFPRVADSGPVTLFYDNNGASLGVLSVQ